MSKDNKSNFIAQLISCLIEAGEYNLNDLVAPNVVLWPDTANQWQAIIPRLQERMPLLVLGGYEPENGTGPAYWLRCILAGTLPDDHISQTDITPIIYLPGVSKVDLRAIEDCPTELRPLAELQYRGVVWTQRNGRDWTISAFLQSEDGLGIEVGADHATKEAMQRSLVKLADETISGLRKSAPLRAPFFDALLSPDDVRRILLWLNDPPGYPQQVTHEEWAAFCSLCQQKYNIDPESDGAISAAGMLGKQAGSWQLVWDRYLETPHLYPNLMELMRSAAPIQPRLMDSSGSWPQDNESAEELLRQRLSVMDQRSPQEARDEILSLEKTHGHRRDWVWARLNQAPLATSLKYLSKLVEYTEKSLVGESLNEIMAGFEDWGWQADSAAIAALNAVSSPQDLAAIQAVLNAVYRPWLEESTLFFQETINRSEGQYLVSPMALPSAGTCVLFCDALRLDAAKHLANEFERLGYSSPVSTHLAALPSITPTSKPALLSLGEYIVGEGATDLSPVVEGSKAPLTAEVFRKILTSNNIQVLKESEYGDPRGIAWTELGAIDAFGHQHGWKLAHHLRAELDNIKNRVISLLEQGWKNVMIITDHGWLLLPGGLPKANLPEHLTVVRKGRCARLKEMAQTEYQTVPWYWDNEVNIAIAPGIHCFEAGKEYEHGGLSPQECVVPVITITPAHDKRTEAVTLRDVSWKGLRCSVYVKGGTSDLEVDIRTKAGDSGTSLVTDIKNPSEDGYVSLLVIDEDKLGESAHLVVLTPEGHLRAQIAVTIGG